MTEKEFNLKMMQLSGKQEARRALKQVLIYMGEVTNPKKIKDFVEKEMKEYDKEAEELNKIINEVLKL